MIRFLVLDEADELIKDGYNARRLALRSVSGAKRQCDEPLSKQEFTDACGNRRCSQRH
jgi:hypothetical protein